MLGWAISKSSNEIVYENEATITYHISSNEPSTFYAVWQKIITAEATNAVSTIRKITDTGLYLLKITGTLTTSIRNEIIEAVDSNAATIELDISECEIVEWEFGEPLEAKSAASIIRNYCQSGTYSVQITGSITSDILQDIANAVKSSSASFELDLSETNGLKVVTGFENCTNLKKIILPTEITTIKVNAFANTSLTEIVIPNGVSVIPAGAFYNCTKLSSVHLADTITEIAGGGAKDAGAFSQCSSLKEISIPQSCKIIGGYAFYDTQLESINLSDITSIGPYALSGTKVSSITLSNQMTEIYDYALAEISVESIIVPDSVQTISEGAFAYNSNLKKISLPSGLTKIGKRAFEGCTSLSDITIPNTVAYIGEYAFAGTAIQTILLPDGITTLYEGTFYNCKNLQYITIPAAVKFILLNVFYGTSISSVVFENKADWEYRDYNGTVEGIDVSSEVFNSNKLRSLEWATNGIRNKNR